MHKQFLLFSILSIACLYNAQAQQTASNPTPPSKEKTALQTDSPWIPQIDVRSDIAIVYGAGDQPGMTFEQRVKSWRDRVILPSSTSSTYGLYNTLWHSYSIYYRNFKSDNNERRTKHTGKS